jgi:CPA2 family monovalent cation:H+ antiporter-2
MVDGLLAELVVAYGVGALVVLVLLRFRVPTVVGFLVAGVLLGPHGLRLVRDVASVQGLADIGVVILLFTIGVEMSLGRLLRMGSTLLVACGLQIALTTAGVALPVGLAGTSVAPALVFGLLVAASSTTLVLRVLGDRGEADAPQGRVATGVSILQDLAVVPIMIFLPMLGGTQTGVAQTSLAIGKALAVLVATVVLARYVVPRLLEAVVETRNRELFALAVIFLCLGTAWGASVAGLSLALGAFLGGLVVSESPYSQQVLGELRPIRDALAGLFFIGVGMLLDLSVAASAPFAVLGTLVAVVVGKALLATVAILVAGYGVRTAVLAGVALSQVGEFSFVLAREAGALGLLDAAGEQRFLAVAVLSMAATPFVYRLAGPLADRAVQGLGGLLRARVSVEHGDAAEKRDHVIVVGFGLTGRHVARALGDHGIDYVAIEMNPETVRQERARGVTILYGDAGHPQILEQAGARHAKMVVVAISDFPGTKRVVATSKQLRPDLPIVVRARYLREVADFQALGADEVVPDELETSVEIFARVLKAYDLPAEAIERTVQAIRADTFAQVRSTAARAGLTPSRAKGVAGVDLEAHVVGPGAPCAGRTLSDLALRARYGVTVVSLRRGDGVVTSPGPATRLEVADVVVVLGAPDRLAAIAAIFRPVPAIGTSPAAAPGLAAQEPPKGATP